MNIFYLLIGVSLLAALIFLAAFIWAVRSGQFDDNETPAIRILFDDDPQEKEEKEEAEEGKIKKNKKQKS
jgi:cbb3-type cytochrome oxidase maturation protein